MAGLALSFAVPPVYQSDVLLAPVSANADAGPLAGLAGQFGGLASLAGVSLNGEDKREAEAVATLGSRALVEELVRDENLLPVLFAHKWDPAANQWKGSDPEDWPSMWDAYQLFEKKIRLVSQDKKTGLVTLTIQWKDPEQAARWATELVGRTNRLLRQRAIARSERNTKFLQDQLNQTSVVEVRQAIYRLLENEIKTAMLAQGSDDYAFKILDPAIVPQERSKPKRSVFTVMGLVAGTALAGLAAMVIGFPRSKAAAA